jgi:integrase
LEARAAKASGVDFKLKDFRPTFATMSVELDPNLLPDISTMLGHADIKTTQRYYAQISCDSAGRRLEAAWQKKLGAECKNDLIEPEKYLSGYA